MDKKPVTRTRCSLCGAAELFPILTLPRFPVHHGSVDAPPAEGEHQRMSWAECPACRAAQVETLPPAERVFPEPPRPAYGAVWTRHQETFASFIVRHAKGSVLDFGSGDGALAAAYRRSGGMGQWTALALESLIAHDRPADVARVESLAKRAAFARFGASTAVLCHTLPLARHLRAAVADISAALPEDGRIVIAWPVLERWTELGRPGALSFARPSLVPLPAMKSLFARAGWQACAQAAWAECDTLFVAFARGGTPAEPFESYRPPAPVIADYFTRFRVRALAIMRAMARHRGDVFLMPSGIAAQVLFASGLTEARIDGILDNDPAKQDKRLYGSTLRVFAPEAKLPKARSPLVIVHGGVHTPEIIEGIRRIRADVAVHDASGTEMRLTDEISARAAQG